MKTVRIVAYFLIFLTTALAAPSAGPSLNIRTGKLEHLHLRKQVFDIFKKRLPSVYKRQAGPIADTIMEQSVKYKIDPMVVTALISGESSFNPLNMGFVGEVGLMQLRPSTAKWIASRCMLKWLGPQSLKNPVTNIRIGMAYLGYLKKRFSGRSGLMYLSAYNMGETALLRLLAKNIRPSIYTNHVMKNYLALAGDFSVWPSLAEVQ
jgi:soluble lytic murein transglycosylase